MQGMIKTREKKDNYCNNTTEGQRKYEISKENEETRKATVRSSAIILDLMVICDR